MAPRLPSASQHEPRAQRLLNRTHGPRIAIATEGARVSSIIISPASFDDASRVRSSPNSELDCMRTRRIASESDAQVNMIGARLVGGMRKGSRNAMRGGELRIIALRSRS